MPRTGARVEQLHRVEIDTISQMHLVEALRQCVDISVRTHGRRGHFGGF